MSIRWFTPVAALVLCSPLVGWAVDNDHDGVEDSVDACPHTAQLKKLDPKFPYAPAVNPERLQGEAKAHPVLPNGCEPDNDGDGVLNSQDYCPDDTAEAIAQGVASNGCPKQSDGDGTPDYRDRCPGTPAGVKADALGCEVKS